jgi:hypothetical protein
MRFLLAVTVTILIAAPSLAAPAPVAAGSESLGGQLLDDLPGGSLPPSTTPPAREPAAVPPTDNTDVIDPELRFFPLRFDDVGGQDVGPQQPSGPTKLARAGQGMVAAESLLRDPATVAQAGKTQVEVVTQLDELIAELSKQCNCKGGKPGDKPPSPSQRSQAKPGKSGSKPGRGNAPARDSNTQLTDKASRPIDKAELDELVKHLWGHLPERQREQMMQSYSDEFLPKYELEIEQYYQRLSEEDDANRPLP